jgi:hypothetical protein
MFASSAHVLGTLGATGVVFGVASYVGQRWATRNAQAHQAKLEAELDRVRAELERGTAAVVDALTRRREVSARLAASLRVLLSGTMPGGPEQKIALLSAYDVACLWAAEPVAEAVGELLDLVRVTEVHSVPQEQIRAAYSKCMDAMRRDCGFPSTTFRYRLVTF